MRLVLLGYAGSVHTCRWASFFADLGHDVHVVTFGGVDAGRAKGARYALHDLGGLRHGKATYLLRARLARARIRALEPDVLHAHHATSYGLLGLLSGVRPFVVTAHGDDVLLSPQRPAMRVVVSRVLRAADLITVPAAHVQAAAERLLGGPDRKILVFQYGVESRRLFEKADAWWARAGPGDARAPLRIVSARALIDLYRVDMLLRAVHALREAGQQCRCDVVGDGAERARLEDLAARLGIADSVHFHGHLPAAEVEEVMLRCQVYVSVAESDGASVALLEAMALGLTPVLSDILANRQWVTDGANGVLVEPGPHALAEGILRAQRLERSRVAQANRETIVRLGDRDRNLGSLERHLAGLRHAAHGPGVIPAGGTS
jgi:glycosyltransferase involved in cell wall biosynthesis